MSKTLNNCMPDLCEEIDFLREIAKAISKKYKRVLMLCYDDHMASYPENMFAIRKDAPFQIIKNNTLITRHHFEKDKEFKEELKSNIKNHLPTKLYNFLVMKAAIDGNGMYELLLNSSGYEALETFMESFYDFENKNDRPISKFFYKIYEDGKVELYA